ncbi:MAG: three-Cys-motif partner protein TcmP [Candidatus Paceibacterota bacterium]
MAKKVFGNDIGKWTELKLEYIRKYLGAYSNILNFAGFKEYCFIDAFAGSGLCKTKKTKETKKGSTLISLSIEPPFTKYFFIELDQNKCDCLKNIVSGDFSKRNVVIKNGDCNKEIDSILKQFNENTPFMALLDPQAGDLYWDTIRKIGERSKAEALINFPFGMAISRYMPLEEKKEINMEMENKIDLIFGCKDWKNVYRERKKNRISPRVAREKYLDIYLTNLISIGFKYYAVKNIKNSIGNHIYYLIYATKNLRGLEKMKDEFVKKEPTRNTLFFLQDLKIEVYKVFNGTVNISLDKILDRLLTGKHCYRKQDFKEVLVSLEKEGKLIRNNKRKGARSFNEKELFSLI